MRRPGHGYRTTTVKEFNALMAMTFVYRSNVASNMAPGLETEDQSDIGGLMYFDDLKPMRHCVFWVRKE